MYVSVKRRLSQVSLVPGTILQNLNLDKEDRSAKITFKSCEAAEAFKKKFNNKMIAASRVIVTLR